MTHIPSRVSWKKTGRPRLLVNVPDRHEIQVADLDKNAVIAHWRVDCEDNFPMALDEAHHRLFVQCRVPASLLVFNTDTGKVVATLQGGSSDDIFYDGNKGQIYVLGQTRQGDAPGATGPGFIEVFQQKDADHYTKLGSYPSGPGAWTGFFVPEWGSAICFRAPPRPANRRHPRLRHQIIACRAVDMRVSKQNSSRRTGIK